jgi:hypothetical protein
MHPGGDGFRVHRFAAPRNDGDGLAQTAPQKANGPRGRAGGHVTSISFPAPGASLQYIRGKVALRAGATAEAVGTVRT